VPAGDAVSVLLGEGIGCKLAGHAAGGAENEACLTQNRKRGKLVLMCKDVKPNATNALDPTDPVRTKNKL